MRKINCLILDDEPLAVKLLQEYAKKSGMINVVFAGTNTENAIVVLKNEIIDLVFLDIQMPQYTGFELMKLFKNQYFILTTAYPNYALDAFKFNVIDYLLKPITFEAFINSISKYNQLIQIQNKSNEVLIFKADRKIYRIETSEILFIEGVKDYVKVHTKTEKIMFLENMKDILLRLPKDQFMRIHRSFIIPVIQIKIIDGNQLFLKDGSVFSIGETYKQSIKEMFS
jgi:two-component system LytT family response regulator